MKKTKVTDLVPHAQNANRGTARGAIQLEESVKRCGLGRSIVVDKHGRIIAGNHLAQTAAELGLEDTIVVKTRGDQLVVVQRDDLDLETDAKAVELAVADNRTSQTNYDPDSEALAKELEAGVDLSAYFREDEIDALKAAAERDAKAIEEASKPKEPKTKRRPLDPDGTGKKNEAKLGGGPEFTVEERKEYRVLVRKLNKRWGTPEAQTILTALREAANAK